METNSVQNVALTLLLENSSFFIERKQPEWAKIVCAEMESKYGIGTAQLTEHKTEVKEEDYFYWRHQARILGIGY